MTYLAVRLYLVAAVLFICIVKPEGLSALALDDFAACAQGGITNSSASHETYILNLTGKQRPWRGMLGFNPSFIAADHKRGDFRGSSFGRLMDLFSPQALRYPPGTFASFYDWDSQTIDEPLVRRYAKKSMLKTIRDQRNRNQGNLIKSDYRSFLSLARLRKVQPFIVLNLLTRDSDEAQEVVADIKKDYKGLIDWELGNEVSNVEYLNARPGSPWNVNVYSERVAKVSGFIRESYPEDMIGIVGAELLKVRGYVHVPVWIERFLRNWAEQMSREADSYDAVIFHPYVNLIKDIIDAGIREQRSVAECTALDQESLRAVVQYLWIFSTAQEVPRAYDTNADHYYPNKQLWLTEVGLFGRQCSPAA